MPPYPNKIYLEQIDSISLQNIRIGDILIYYRRQHLAEKASIQGISTDFKIYEVTGLPSAKHITLNNARQMRNSRKILRSKLVTGRWWLSGQLLSGQLNIAL